MTDTHELHIDLDGEPFSYTGLVKCNVAEVDADGPDPDADYGRAYNVTIIEACEGSLTITREMMVQAYSETRLREIEQHLAVEMVEGTFDYRAFAYFKRRRQEAAA